MEQNILDAISKLQIQFEEKLDDLENKIINSERNVTSNINDNIDGKFNRLNDEIEDLRKESVEQEKRIDIIEKSIRMKNLVLFGVAEEERSYMELETLLIEIINSKLEIEVGKNEIEFVKRIGKKTNKARPIVFGLTTLGKKIQILQNKKKLQGTNCYIKEDFPKKVQELRKSLQPLLEKEIEQGNRAIIKYDKLVVLGKQKRQLSQSPSPPSSNEKQNQCSIQSQNLEKNILKEPKNKKIKHNEFQPKSPRQNNIKQYTTPNSYPYPRPNRH
ncbi:unnamed protein product [Plutella xylostella]|uniref:(diamondback moth) hypothetical protein n=1 Tax=Plutella xylostella TaxID=51655 RepID=A0A8S4FHL0_PLUXY|nr:unnamed protein product [Plutella xylostella]